MNRNINWHSRNDIHHETGPDSRFLTSQIWINDLEEDIRANGVEIIELNTSANSQTSNEHSPENPHLTNHPWSYATRFSSSEDTCKANRQARLRRRLRNKNRFPENGALDNEFDSSIYFDNTWTPDTADVEAFNQTCFTILDKLSALELESSPEDFKGSGNEASREVTLDAGWKSNGETGEELVSYGSGLDGEKHTIWIYSFKNRRMLSAIDFESVNIPGRESVASSSSSEIDEELNTSKSARVPSPIPAAHIQRLDLSLGATLPNVTEVTEPKSSESLNRKKHAPITQKPANRWCLDISEKETVTENKVTNIENWMALSPRERRRHSRHSSEAPIQLQPVTEVSKDDEKERSREPFETETTKSTDFQADKPNLEEIEIETLDETKFFKPPSQINSQRSSANSKREKFRDNATYLISPFPPRRVNLDLSYKAEHESQLTKLKNAVRGAWSDRCHYKVRRPQITVDKPFPLSPITRPIETLDSNDWIAEHEPKSYRQDRTRQVMSAGDRLMIRNMSLLKPAEWKSYSPVTGSRLSIDLGSELEPKKTLLQRCFGCFKCCK